MDLQLIRLAGAPAPALADLNATLWRLDWLSYVHRAPGAGGDFTFPGGTLNILARLAGRKDAHVFPAIRVQAWRAARFEWLAPRLVALAQELDLGVETGAFPAGSRWWEPPPSLDACAIDRAIAVSQPFEDEEAWPLLGFCLAGPDCLELAESQPILAALVATAHGIGDRQRSEMPAAWTATFRELARRPRREILQALGLPSTRSMLRILARVASGPMEFSALWLLARQRLAPRMEKALRHLPRLTSGAVRLAASPTLSPHVGVQLLREAAEGPDNGYITLHLRDTLKMADRLRRLDEIGVIRSRAHLMALHDAILELYNTRPVPMKGTGGCIVLDEPELDTRAEAGAPRPPCLPPPAGTATIEALTTPEALLQEGRELQHCVGSYDDRVGRGTCAVYRVLEPERATLSLAWRPDRGAWQIEQLRGIRNHPVGPPTEKAVRDWLAQAANP